MGILEGLFGLEKPYFILGNGEKLPLSSIAKILMGLCIEKHQELSKQIIELIPEDLLTQNINSFYRFNIITLSFQLGKVRTSQEHCLY